MLGNEPLGIMFGYKYVNILTLMDVGYREELVMSCHFACL